MLTYEMSMKDLELPLETPVKAVEVLHSDHIQNLVDQFQKLPLLLTQKNQDEFFTKDNLDFGIGILKTVIESLEKLKMSEDSISMDSFMQMFQPEKLIPIFSALQENIPKISNQDISAKLANKGEHCVNNSINHIAIIPDGNRRWAKQNGYQPWNGHNVSQKILNRIVHTLWTRGVHTITVWLMSPENFNRSAEELQHLWIIFEMCFSDARVLAKEFNARCCHVGNKHRLPTRINQLINSIEEDTKGNTGKRLNFAIDYSGREDILRAVGKTESERKYTHDSNYVETIKKNLWGGDQLYPEPDLIVRTGAKDSKTVRMSGFMIWQSVYSELLFVDKYMPEVSVDDVDSWIDSFKGAERRFGK